MRFAIALLAFTFAALMSESAHAAKFARIQQLADPAMQQLAMTVQAANSLTGSAAYQIVVPTPDRGRSADVVELQTLKQAMVSGVCQFFDEAIDLSPASTVQEAFGPLSEYVSSNGSEVADANIAAITAGLNAVAAEPNMVMYGGRASGNNTIGAELGIVDRAHNQILVFGSSNCGSDN